MKFNDNADKAYCSDKYYDLFNGGYIRPGDLLLDKEDSDIVIEAMNIVDKFLDEAEDAGLIEFQ